MELPKIPLLNRGKKPPKNNGQVVLDQEGVQALLEHVVQTVDQRMDERDVRRANVSDEEYKDLRKALFETPRRRMRQLTIRSERSAALDPQVYGISYLTSPGLFWKEGWGLAIMRSYGPDGVGGVRKKITHVSYEEYVENKFSQDAEIIGYTRTPGDLLPFTMQMVEEIARSSKGFLITHTVGLTRMQVESEEDAKHMSSPGA